MVFSVNTSTFGQAQQYPLPPTRTEAAKPVNWVRGPGTAPLAGDAAEIKIPDGYAFLSVEDGAAPILKRMNYPAPKSLAGILVPVSGINWVMVLEFKAIGYVKDDTQDHMDPAAILQTLQHQIEQQQVARGGTPTVPAMDWAAEPQYNAGEHTIEWALGVQGSTGKLVNHVVRVLGRNGVIDGVTAQSDRVSLDAIPLKSLMSGVSFKKGYAYVDYRKGDRISTVALTDVFTPESAPEKSPLKARLLLGLAGFVVVCGGTGGWVLRRRIVRNRKLAEARLAAPPLASPAQPHTNGSENGSPKAPRPLPATVNHANGKHNGHYRRRRMFNYQKYYSDLLLQVSDRAYDRAFELGIPKATRNGNGNGNGNGKSNGNGNGNGVESIAHPVPADHGFVNNAPDNGASSTVPPAHDANRGLIASQTNLIEEQQRLIREQTKLIEEKTRLIHEKNQVLEKQAELFGNNLF